MLFALNEKGQSLIESVILLALVALIIIAILWLLGFRMGHSYARMNGFVS